MYGFQQEKSRVFVVNAEWDSEVGVWVVTSDDIPGLVAEGETQDEVREKLMLLIPELFELNGIPPCDEEVPVELLIQSEERLAINC